MRALLLTRLAVVSGLALGVLLGTAAPASAHPLGNFTTNRYARVEVGASVLRVHYVLDEAELVAFRQREALAAEDVDSYRDRRVEDLRRGLRLTLDGDVVPLQTVTSKLAQPKGEGGLTTLRIDAVFEAPLADRSSTDATFADANGFDLLGWREIVVTASPGADISGSAPTQDRTDGLRDYPTDPGEAPLDVRSVRFSFTPGGDDDRPASVPEGVSAGVGGGRFTNLVASTASSPAAVAGALLAAFGFGIVHALGPGHGKTMMAAYLVSTKGRRRDAFALAAVVTLMHTASVLALATLLATVGRRLDATRLYPVLTTVAGVLVAGIGVRLALRRGRAARATASVGHHHDHEHHGHDHYDHAGAAAVPTPGGGGPLAVLDRPTAPAHAPGHTHHHGPGGHTHDLPPDVRPLSTAGLVALGTSGGLFPSPSAVVVLVGAFALGRAALGLAMIAAFSLGLGAMLVTVGVVLVAGRDRLARSRFYPQLPWLPTAGAVVIVALGAVLVVQGIGQLR